MVHGVQKSVQAMIRAGRGESPAAGQAIRRAG